MEETLKCPWCDRIPEQISEYKDMAVQGEYKSPEEAMKAEEGTYNHRFNLFCCTSCYIKIGMPLQPKLNEAYQVYRDGNY